MLQSRIRHVTDIVVVIIIIIIIINAVIWFPR